MLKICRALATFCLSSITEGSHARQCLALQKFQGGSTARTAMGNLVFRVILLACSGGVAAANHRDGACSSCSNNRVHKGFSTNLKLRHLEDTHWSIPNDGLGGIHCCLVHLHGLWTTIQAHETVWNASFLRRLLDFAVLSKLRGDGEVHWQNNFHTKLLRFLHDLRNNFGPFFIIEGCTDPHAIVHFQKCVRHATTHNHLVHLVQHVHDELDFVAHLSSAQDGQNRLGRRFQNLRESI